MDEKHHWFTTTHWTVIAAAQHQDRSAAARVALEQLCKTYWLPLYNYGRRCGYSPEDAQDLTQSFFCHFLEHDLLGHVGPEKGRFRSFLLASLKNFLSHEREAGRAQKRTGGLSFSPVEQAAAEKLYQQEIVADNVSPEILFDRHWALTVLAQAKTQLGEDYQRTGKGAIYHRLKRFLEDEVEHGEHYRQEAAELLMTPGAVNTAVHRLRQRYGEIIHREIARTVAVETEVEEEYRYLREILSQGRQ